MRRITVSIDEPLADQFDDLIAARGYQSRSEGVADLMRKAVETRYAERGAGDSSVGVLSYIYNSKNQQLSARLSTMEHDHHDLIGAVMHTVLDHEHRLVSMILRGSSEQVRRFADEVQALRGVTLGAMNVIGVVADDSHLHAHDHDHPGHPHLLPAILRDQ